jgi:hypothetical protein
MQSGTVVVGESLTPDTGMFTKDGDDYAVSALSEVLDICAVIFAVLIAVKVLKWYNREYEKEGFIIWDNYGCDYRRTRDGCFYDDKQ